MVSKKRYLVTEPTSFLGPVRKSDVMYRGVVFLEYFGRPKFKADWSSTVILVQHAPYYSTWHIWMGWGIDFRGKAWERPCSLIVV